MSAAEVVLFLVLAAWSAKIVWLWWRRNDANWKPRFPLCVSYGSLVLAHLASALSSFAPDPLLVVKFALRPVLFNYLAFIALPVNLIRSLGRLRIFFGIIAGVGTFAAAVGLISVFFPGGIGSFIGRAHPIPLFGVGALGGNQNELAELLVFTPFVTLALASLSTPTRWRRLFIAASLFQILICLLAFTRSGWIILAIQGAVLGGTVWRKNLAPFARSISIGALCVLPLIGIMIAASSSQTAKSSNSTRLMLSQIAVELFSSSPWVGAGAGTFVDRVGSTRVFLIEYGAPLDSHGFLQKLAAETGLFGLFAFGFILIRLTVLCINGIRSFSNGPFSRPFIFCVTGMAGAVGYQFFNTSYWTGKMWLPVGVVMVALHVFENARRDILKE